MSGWGNEIARRPLLTAIAAALGIAVAGGAALEILHPFRRTIPGPYGDLVSLLPDPDASKAFGKMLVAHEQPMPDLAALRARLAHASLESAIAGDLAAGRLVEVHGWVLPQIVTGLAIAAARNG